MIDNVSAVLQKLSEGLTATSPGVAQRAVDIATVMQNVLNADEFARWLERGDADSVLPLR